MPEEIVYCVACKRKYRVKGRIEIRVSGRNKRKFRFFTGKCPKGHKVNKAIGMVGT